MKLKKNLIIYLLLALLIISVIYISYDLRKKEKIKIETESYNNGFNDGVLRTIQEIQQTGSVPIINENNVVWTRIEEICQNV